MKKFSISFVQRGIAPEVGLDQSGRTTVYASIIGSDWNHVPFFYVEGDEKEDEGIYFFNPVYAVEVTHPEVYAGTSEEFRSEIIRYAKKALRKAGALVECKTRSGLPEEFLKKVD